MATHVGDFYTGFALSGWTAANRTSEIVAFTREIFDPITWVSGSLNGLAKKRNHPTC
jgi:hypothetical protein